VRRFRRNASDHEIFLAWLPPEVRAEILARGPGWKEEQARWHWWWMHGENERGQKIWDQVTRAFNRGENLFLFDPENHYPPWHPRRRPEPPESPAGHSFEYGSNPDEGLRAAERQLAGGAGPEELAQHARRRQRSGEAVDPWELVPVSYVFLEAYQEFARQHDRDKAESGGRGARAGNITRGRVEAFRDPVFLSLPKVSGAKYPDPKPEKFYVAPCSYPLLAPNAIRPRHSTRREEEGLHLEGVERWRQAGAIVVRLEFESEREHLEEDHGGGRHYDEEGVCTYCRWIDSYRWRVLTRVEDIRNAIGQPGWYSGWHHQDVILPAQWDWARIMNKRRGRWKNNPREMRIPLPRSLYPATEAVLPIGRNPRKRKPITTEVQRDGLDHRKDLVIFAYAGKRKIGHIQVFRVKRPAEDLKPDCLADLQQIQGSRPGITAFVAWKSFVAPRYRRRRVGVALYEAALSYLRAKYDPMAVALVPMHCLSYGTTSADAKRVWESIARSRPRATPRAILANRGCR
jgi:GNAT superfamily N-acetyltransferase